MDPELLGVVSSSPVAVAPGCQSAFEWWSRSLCFQWVGLWPATKGSRKKARKKEFKPGKLNNCDLGVFRSHCFLLLLLGLIFNKNSQILKEWKICKETPKTEFFFPPYLRICQIPKCRWLWVLHLCTLPVLVNRIFCCASAMSHDSINKIKFLRLCRLFPPLWGGFG